MNRDWFKNYQVPGIDWFEDVHEKKLTGTIHSNMSSKSIVAELVNCPVDKPGLNAKYVTENIEISFPKNTAEKKILSVLDELLKASPIWIKDCQFSTTAETIRVKTNYRLDPEAFFL